MISNKADAKGLVFAREQGIATEVLDHKAFDSRDAFDAALAGATTAFAAGRAPAGGAGGLCSISRPVFRNCYAGRLVNIHPRCYRFPGLHTHQRAIEAGCSLLTPPCTW